MQYIFTMNITNFNWFSSGSSILAEMELGDVGFCGERKTGKPENRKTHCREKPWEEGEHQQQTRLTCGRALYLLWQSDKPFNNNGPLNHQIKYIPVWRSTAIWHEIQKIGRKKLAESLADTQGS